ncbi:hypothetical protein P8452_76661 [Trifolium repens]|nr:hypothetical protein P8452_76661 [Trifolium repens]
MKIMFLFLNLRFCVFRVWGSEEQLGVVVVLVVSASRFGVVVTVLVFPRSCVFMIDFGKNFRSAIMMQHVVFVFKEDAMVLLKKMQRVADFFFLPFN